MTGQRKRKGNNTDVQLDDEEIGIDRISELPEPLIVFILSLLDMKNAVKTCILSRKWKYFWTCVDTIVFQFEFSSGRLEKLKQFTSFVDRTLMQCTCPNIKTFSFTSSPGFYPGDSKFILRAEKLLDKWIEFVLAKNVQVIKLVFEELPYEIPVRLYQSSSLQTLEIDDLLGNDGTALVNSETGFDLSWKVLKTLYLSGVYVDDEFLEKILLGSPMLETIVLSGISSLSKINIISPSVSELKLLGMWSIAEEEETVLLDIIAPWVKKLEVGGLFNYLDYNVVNVNSLEKASLALDYSHRWTTHDEEYMLDIMINKLLKPVCRAYELVIGVELLQALSLYQLRSEPSIIFQCKDLEINSPICEHEVPGIICLLASSPYLENLIVTLIPWQHCQSTDVDDDIANYKKYANYMGKVFSSFDGVEYLSQKKTFPCLKSVVIDCKKKLYSLGDCMCYELEIAAFIIKHSPILKKLVLLSAKSNCGECGVQYFSLLSSEDKVGKKATQWELKKMGSTYNYSFSR